MTKQHTIQKYFNQRRRLSVTNHEYRVFLARLVKNVMRADLGSRGDVTATALIDPRKMIHAHIVTREAGVAAGTEEIKWLFGKKFNIQLLKSDGARIKAEDAILVLSGRARDVLQFERTILNFLQRMSGIATATRELVSTIKNRCLICPTRKTPHGLLDKKAVAVGGGGTHRLGLYDFILVKENHLALLSRPLSECRIKGFWEIEVENEKQASEYAKLKPGALMFDNMSPAAIRRAVKILPHHIIFEASGGITKENIKEYAITGVDIISIGALTHSVRALDMGLDIL